MHYPSVPKGWGSDRQCFIHKVARAKSCTQISMKNLKTVIYIPGTRPAESTAVASVQIMSVPTVKPEQWPIWSFKCNRLVPRSPQSDCRQDSGPAAVNELLRHPAHEDSTRGSSRKTALVKLSTYWTAADFSVKE